jgi:hypothetical protein
MTTTQIIAAVKSIKGNQICLTFKTEGKPAAKFKETKLTKLTSGCYRKGIAFENLKGIREDIENGVRDEVGPLPKNMEWVEFPLHLRHQITGQEYLRLYYPVGGFIQSPSVIFMVNGMEVTKEEYQSYLTESDRNKPAKDSNRDCFMLKLENIVSIDNLSEEDEEDEEDTCDKPDCDCGN